MCSNWSITGTFCIQQHSSIVFELLISAKSLFNAHVICRDLLFSVRYYKHQSRNSALISTESPYAPRYAHVNFCFRSSSSLRINLILRVLPPLHWNKNIPFVSFSVEDIVWLHVSWCSGRDGRAVLRTANPERCGRPSVSTTQSSHGPGRALVPHRLPAYEQSQNMCDT